MFKTKVQELCQRRSWTLPDYQTSREGPDHNPRFTSTVTVHGLTFQTPLPCRTAKEAQNNAAKLAFDHFTNPNPNPHPHPNPPSSSSSPPLPPPRSSPFPQSSLPQPSSPFSQSSLPQPSSPFSQSSLSPPSSPFSQSSLPLPPSLEGFSLPGLSFPQPSLTGISFPQPSPTATSCSGGDNDVELPPLLKGSLGPSTDVDNIVPTTQVLQPNLQEACQTSQTCSPVTVGRDIMTAGGQKNMSRLYKNQLQTYAQKRNLSLPVYSTECEGPPHAIRFKCKVTIDGQTYESSEIFSTLKDAEHAAAKVALMSLSPDGAQEDDAGLYKNLLQELIQKEGFCLPKYDTSKSGEAHMPTFVSQVEVEGEFFTGQEAKSKKQAEMSAAKVAYTTLKERKAHQAQAPEFSSTCSTSNFATGQQHHANTKSPVRSSPGLVTQNLSDKEPVVVTGTKNKGSPSSPSTNGCVKDSSTSNEQFAPSFSNCSNVVTTSDEPSTAAGTPSCRKKVVVYSRKTNVEIAEGGTLLPISDDKWAAYSYN